MAIFFFALSVVHCYIINSVSRQEQKKQNNISEFKENLGAWSWFWSAGVGDVTPREPVWLTLGEANLCSWVAWPKLPGDLLTSLGRRLQGWHCCGILLAPCDNGLSQEHKWPHSGEEAGWRISAYLFIHLLLQSLKEPFKKKKNQFKERLKNRSEYFAWEGFGDNLGEESRVFVELLNFAFGFLVAMRKHNYLCSYYFLMQQCYFLAFNNEEILVLRFLIQLFPFSDSTIATSNTHQGLSVNK